MKKQLLSILLIALSLCCFAQNSIDFEIRNLGINVDGHFGKFSVTTNFDDSNTLKSISGEITVKSINTGIDSRDEHLLEEDYFHSSKFPKITLSSIDITKKRGNNYSAKVNLTIKGKSKQITIPLQVKITEKQRKISSQFQINRKDFKVGGNSFVMSKTVKISVSHTEKIK